MERVQFQQEQMLSELKDLVQKGLFTQAETKQIMKKRTQFETALVRRVAKKSDFLRYAAYEMSLEQLRRKRIQRMKLPKTKTTISDYALVRRQYQIFERALRRFKSDVALWIQYIQVAKREGARALVGRITARALQLHPHVPSLYILAASHELSHMSPSAARSLLQRGLRLNADSVDMWREYVRMEMGFIENMRRRWDVLGINVETEGDDESNKGKQTERDVDMGVSGDIMIIDDDGEKPPDEVLAAEQHGNEGEAARKAIMDGAIVKSTLLSAAKALPRIELFSELETLIRTFPCLAHLRTTLLDYLYSLLQEAIPDDPRSVKMRATRRLREVTRSHESAEDNTNSDTSMDSNEMLIDALQYANEQLVSAVKSSRKQPKSGSTRTADKFDISDIYADFVLEWCRTPTLDSNLKQYLMGSLQSLAQDPDASSALQATHIRLLFSDSGPSKKTLKFARRYSLTSASPSVWLARLDVEHASDDHNVGSTWALARAAVQSSPDEDGIEKVWLWRLDHCPSEERQARYEDLLKQSVLDSSSRTIHETLLLRYASDVIYSEHTDVPRRRKLVRQISSAYLPTKLVWQRIFTLECAREDLADKTVLSTTYEYWRPVDGIQATLAWAGWLMDRGDGKEAVKVIGSAMAQLTTDQRSQLSQLWSSRLKDDNRETEDDDISSRGDGVAFPMTDD
ncbi:U3 small nucleolar RNA-associated protein 6-domain-containing protein [Phlebopus sp. FC_14]|nr:U3 small nucleolar RNA-associated protein 6-domain-containing protein [Phlebopus sp. FC_14]